MDIIISTCENLKCLTDLKHNGERFDYTTNLINSCWGLIVFPYIQLHSNKPQPNTILEIDRTKKYGNIRTCRKGLWNDDSFEVLREHMYNAIVHGNIMLYKDGDRVESIRFYDYEEGDLVFDAIMTPSQLRQLELDIANKYLHENQ